MTRARWVQALWIGTLFLLLTAAPASANAKFVWNGNDEHTLWSSALSWAGHEAPKPSDGTVDLEFPISGCGFEASFEFCGTAQDDIPGLTVGTLTLAARVIRFTSKSPMELPPFKPQPLSYGIGGTQPVRLEDGLDLEVLETGTGEGVVATGGTSISDPVELVGTNAWSIGPAPGGQLDVSGGLTGAHPLAVTLGVDDSLGLTGPVEVGPLTIRGGENSYGYVGGQPINGEDGEPVTIEGTSMRLGGSIGPLTLRGSMVEAGGSPQFAGPVSVDGPMSLDAASGLDLEEPWEAPPLTTIVKASGPISLGRAVLDFWDPCPTPGTTYTLLEAPAIEGLFSNRDGSALTSGTEIPGTKEGCGPKQPSVPVRIEYSAQKVTATALSPPSVSTSPGSVTPLAGTGTEAFKAFGGAWLADVLKGNGSRGRIAKLLHGGGVKLHVTTPVSGVLKVKWTVVRGHRMIALATGTLTQRAAGVGVLHLRLTKAGRAFLGHAKQVHGIATAVFEPVGGGVSEAAANLLLRR